MTRTITLITVALGTMVAAAAQDAQSKPQTYKNLEVTVTGVEHAASAALNDCPPGANTVKGMTRPGEQFAIVKVAFKILPGYQPAPLKRPVLQDAAGTTYNTAVSFVDVGTIPEFSCSFPFRMPEGTKLKSFQIETLSFDLGALDSKKP